MIFAVVHGFGKLCLETAVPFKLPEFFQCHYLLSEMSSAPLPAARLPQPSLAGFNESYSPEFQTSFVFHKREPRLEKFQRLDTLNDTFGVAAKSSVTVVIMNNEPEIYFQLIPCHINRPLSTELYHTIRVVTRFFAEKKSRRVKGLSET